MEREFLFCKQECDCGDVDKKGLAVWRFDFEDYVDLPIEYIHLGCSCTKLTKVTDKYIEGTVNVQMSGYDTQSRYMQNNIVVCFDDGETEYIAKAGTSDEGLRRTINPRKKRESLVIKANVLK